MAYIVMAYIVMASEVGFAAYIVMAFIVQAYIDMAAEVGFGAYIVMAYIDMEMLSSPLCGIPSSIMPSIRSSMPASMQIKDASIHTISLGTRLAYIASALAHGWQASLVLGTRLAGQSSRWRTASRPVWPLTHGQQASLVLGTRLAGQSSPWRTASRPVWSFVRRCRGRQRRCGAPGPLRRQIRR